MESWLKKNAIGMNSTQNERKSVIAERFIRTLKNKIYKYMTSTSKSMHVDKLDEKVNKCNNICHRTVKMKPVEVKSSTFIASSKEISDTDFKFEADDIARISK